ncbi:MAG: rane fusion protein multidrug efflux system [Acetobacteraceae bacterium]|jgi:multidrug efflux system membrane fusion protein|nr:rane fusion protein multidrug efflux system [Acetobacteraceae bacterium]
MLVSLAIVAAAVGLGGYALHRSSIMPTTDDASIDADVVHVAAEVGGRIVSIPVEENGHVSKGDLLFQIDPAPYQLSVDQARANLEVAKATLETQRRFLSTQRSSAAIAADQMRSAETNLDLATRTVERLGPLAARGYVPTQQLDQAQTAQRDAVSSLQQARERQAASVRAIDTDAAAIATVQARQAELAIAERHLHDATVRATHAGRVVGLAVLSGEMVAPGQSLFTLVNDEAWFAVGNFRETDLHAIAVGDCVTVYSMIDRTAAIKGVVQGLGAGVLDTDRITLPRSVPYVQRSLNWVIVAQRFPVRVRLVDPPPHLVRLGATSVVEIKHGASCG